MIAPILSGYLMNSQLVMLLLQDRVTAGTLGISYMNIVTTVICWVVGGIMINRAIHYSRLASEEYDWYCQTLEQEQKGESHAQMDAEAEASAEATKMREFLRQYPQFVRAPRSVRESAFKSWQQPREA